MYNKNKICYLIRARAERPRTQMLERVLKILSEHFHKFSNCGLLLDAEHPVVRALGVVQVIALVPVERLLEDHVHVHVEVSLVALLAANLWTYQI